MPCRHVIVALGASHVRALFRTLEDFMSVVGGTCSAFRARLVSHRCRRASDSPTKKALWYLGSIVLSQISRAF